MGTPAIPENPAKAVSLAARALTRAAHTQATAPHDHADFAAIASQMSEVLQSLYTLNTNLAAQIAHYSDDRILRSDDGRDAEEVMATIGYHGSALQNALTRAQAAADKMHLELARIAVRVDLNAEGAR